MMKNGTSGDHRIDWSDIHRRLEQSAAALEGKIVLTAEKKKQTLRERARLLSRENAGAPAEKPLEVLEFTLAYESYGIELGCVREVWPLKDYAEVPGTPRFIFGIVNVRGRIVSVVDLKHFFDLPAKGLTDFNKIIIIGNEHMEFGLLADAVANVRQVRPDEIGASLPTLTGVRLDYLKGVTDDRLIVLDGGKLLSDPKISIT